MPWRRRLRGYLRGLVHRRVPRRHGRALYALSSPPAPTGSRTTPTPSSSAWWPNSTGCTPKVTAARTGAACRAILTEVEKSVAQGQHPVPVDVSGEQGAHAMTIIAQEGDMLQVYNPGARPPGSARTTSSTATWARLPTVIFPTRTAHIFRGSRGGAAIAAAALLALATGCGSGPDEPAGGSTSRPVKDTSITAEPGERFTLTVDQNASTREYWYLVDPEPDSSVLVSCGQVYASDSGDEAVAGAGGRLTFTFEAKGKGTTRFTLLHCTFTTCQGNTSALPPETTGPSATPTTGATTPSQAPERITYTVTVN